MKPIIHKAHSLKNLNSLSLDCQAEYFCTVSTIENLTYALDFAASKNLTITILGEGTNVILNKRLTGLVLKIDIRGKKFKIEGEFISLEVGAGESWTHLVDWALNENWYGLENLSLIPGNVGAAPIQNIGAFGVELSERLISVKAMCRETGEVLEFDSKECEFGYRYSIFKSRSAENFIITGVNLRLNAIPTMNYSYPSLKKELEKELGVLTDSNLSPKIISSAVKKVRLKNLPDPISLPNVGSFFKNPIIERNHLNDLLDRHPELPYFPVSNDLVKIPAAWMIEYCGFRGYKHKNVGVHNSHALVLVNYGSGSFCAIMELANLIKDTVEQCFFTTLLIEPTLYGTD